MARPLVSLPRSCLVRAPWETWGFSLNVETYSKDANSQRLSAHCFLQLNGRFFLEGRSQVHFCNCYSHLHSHSQVWHPGSPTCVKCLSFHFAWQQGYDWPWMDCQCEERRCLQKIELIISREALGDPGLFGSNESSYFHWAHINTIYSVGHMVFAIRNLQIESEN